MSEITERLFGFKDKKYGEFQSKLIPTVDKARIIGVRTPELRSVAKQLVKNGEYKEFIETLPHAYFEEDQLHAFVLSEINDFDECLKEIERFLPYVDNWATCDQLSPKTFKKRRIDLLSHIKGWLASEKTYIIRFGVGMLMRHYLDEDFSPEYPEAVAAVRTDEYYVKMMVAWYFATALSKRYDEILPFIEGRRLDPWTHNKAIQKAKESFRITPEQKEYLSSLKI